MVKKISFVGVLKRLDFFATNIAFRENRGDSFGSVFGACTSLFIALIVASYATRRIGIMFDNSDTKFNEYSVKNGLSQEEFG